MAKSKAKPVPSATKGVIKKMEKSMKDKKAAFMKKCNADLDLKGFETKKRIILYALKMCKGNISNACKLVNITRMTFHNYKTEDPLFEEMCLIIKMGVLDHVVDKLMNRIEAESDTAIIYYLNCQGKEEGWGNSVKVDGSVKNINYNVPLTDEEVKKYAKALEEEF